MMHLKLAFAYIDPVQVLPLVLLVMVLLPLLNMSPVHCVVSLGHVQTSNIWTVRYSNIFSYTS